MHEYLDATKPAATGIIELLRAEQLELHKAELLSKEFKDREKSAFEAMKTTAADSTILFEWLESSNAAENFRHNVAQLKKTIADLDVTYNALAGSLLQIAKQGISSVHSGLGACPPGRMVGTEPLKNIIWQARNQSMHYEEGKFTPAVVKCFTHLAATFGPKFQLGTSNLALSVIDVLGWRTYVAYEKDMSTLLQ